MKLTRAQLATHVASTDGTRPHLQAIYLTRAGAVSTDGHRLLCAPIPGADELGPDEVIALPVDGAAMLAKTLGPKGSGVVDLAATRDNGHVFVTAGTSRVAVDKLPAEDAERCPNWRNVVPADGPVAVVGINAKYLAELATRLAAAGDDRVLRLELFGVQPTGDPDDDARAAARQVDAGRPIRLSCGPDDRRAWALCMPVRL